MDPIVLIAIYRRQKKRRRYRKQFWVHPLNVARDSWGEHLKIEEMYIKYPEKFREYTRLSPEQFDQVLLLVGPKIERQDTNYRKSLSTKFRLFETLRYLATGDNIRTIATNYSVGNSTVWTIIRETTRAIWTQLGPKFVEAPSTVGQWDEIIEGFYSKWNFPNCLGSIDGKHVVIEAPPQTGSMYYNYKNSFSIILLATCDAEYRFKTIDVGAYGKQSDGGVFSASRLGTALEQGTVMIPQPKGLPDANDIVLPCAFLGDEAFPLRLYLMRPYPGNFLVPLKRIFNYRLSRARRVIENCFGIMATRFRIFRRPIAAFPENVCEIVKACIALHNFLRTEDLNSAPNNRNYCPVGYADEGDLQNGGWRTNGEINALREIRQLSSNMHTRVAKEIRDQLANYFSNEGSVSWQDSILGLQN